MNLGKINSKICPYCKDEFSDIDFPAQFNRMVTCGKTECMKSRRLERIRKNISKKGYNVAEG